MVVVVVIVVAVVVVVTPGRGASERVPSQKLPPVTFSRGSGLGLLRAGSASASDKNISTVIIEVSRTECNKRVPQTVRRDRPAK